MKLRKDWSVLGDLIHLEGNLQSKFTVRIFGMGEDGLWAVIDGPFTHCDFHDYNEVGVVFPYVERTDTQFVISDS